jgi:flagellar biosynthesis chaperone FliJ
MTWGEELRSAIRQRDATALHKMTEEARKEETQMFLNLLADLIHQQPGNVTQLKRTA